MSDLSTEEVEKMEESFKKIGVKPKCESPEELKSWMVELVSSGALGDVKVKVHTTLVHTMSRQPPRIAIF